MTVPGTHEPGFVEAMPVELSVPATMRAAWKKVGVVGGRCWRMGECHIIRAREPAGVERERLWHLSISHPTRHPSWDEIKTARYRMLPGDICVGILLPPPERYIDLHPHTFHLWEVTDPRAPWIIG